MLDFLKPKANPMKGYKVTDMNRKRKYGIAADSLSMLMKKACLKFSMDECKLYLAQDGSLVEDEDYFRTIEPQSLFIVAAKDDIVKTDFELLLETIQNSNSDLLHAGDLVRNFVQEHRSDILKIINNLDGEITAKTLHSNKENHPEWFEGETDAKAQTKEEVMARKSRDRIRGYFYKTKDIITKSPVYRENTKVRKMLDEILLGFNLLLIGVDNFSCMFDRKFKRKHPIIEMQLKTDESDGPLTKKHRNTIKDHMTAKKILQKQCRSLCTFQGDFLCQGQWNRLKCEYENHIINPYTSRENLILFQTWNLDHQLELSRNILPSLLENVKRVSVTICAKHKRATVNISVIKYFLRIFTLDNLKLVHIACHDKGSHTTFKLADDDLVCDKCDAYLIVVELLNIV